VNGLLLTAPLALVLGLALVRFLARARNNRLAIRAEHERIEQQKRWAERRLYDIADNAFSAMLAEARRYQNLPKSGGRS
jgi:hypothetical protein